LGKEEIVIEETGVVVKTDGIMAKILVQKRGSCESCAATGICESSEKGMEIEALNLVHAKVGQTVKVSIKPQTYLKGTMLVYGFPLVALIGGAILGKNIGEKYLQGTNSDLIAAIVGFSLLILSFLLIKIWSKKTETKVEYKPIIEEILNSQS
jgi:sigma-E factor negative regulatory protein RseC